MLPFSVFEKFDKKQQFYVYGDNLGTWSNRSLYQEMKLGVLTEKVKEVALKDGYFALSLESP